MPFADILDSEFRASGLEVSASARDQLVLYAEEIERWNRGINLTALRGAALVRRLIVEPIRVGQHLQMSGVLADVGSGNGSPGIPLLVAGCFSSAYLIEPRTKRAAFLRHVKAKLNLGSVTVLKNRVQELPDRMWIADWIVLQAIDPTAELIEALRKTAHETTRVVWITSLDSPPVRSAEKVEIPKISAAADSATKVWLFQLDQI